MKKNFIVFTTVALTLLSCASENKTPEKNPFDALTLKQNLIEGKTTQLQVLEVFGAPDITLENNKKEDVWTYSRSKQESESLGGGVGALAAFIPGPLALIGGNVDASKSETSSKMITVTLRFDRKKILKNYSITKSKS